MWCIFTFRTRLVLFHMYIYLTCAKSQNTSYVLPRHPTHCTGSSFHCLSSKCYHHHFKIIVPYVFLYLILSRLRMTWIIYKRQFVLRSKHITSRFKTNRQTWLSVSVCTDHHQATITKFQNKAKYSEIMIHTMVVNPWWWCVPTETRSHAEVIINVVMFDGFKTDCIEGLPKKHSGLSSIKKSTG